MSTTKVTTQKVIAVLKKAGLSISGASGRFSSAGYQVRAIYADHAFIEIDYTRGSRAMFTGSYTQAKLEKLTSAACVLLEAGVEVLISDAFGRPIGERGIDHTCYTLYVRKDPNSVAFGKLPYDLDVMTQHFAELIANELEAEAVDRAEKDAKRIAAEQAQAERLARVDLLNPTIGIDHNYLTGLFTTHVTLLDGRLAVLIVAYTPKQEYDWGAMKDGDGNRPMFNCFDVELTYIAPDKYSRERWERGTSNFTTGKGESFNSGIRYWISRQ